MPAIPKNKLPAVLARVIARPGALGELLRVGDSEALASLVWAAWEEESDSKRAPGPRVGRPAGQVIDPSKMTRRSLRALGYEDDHGGPTEEGKSLPRETRPKHWDPSTRHWTREEEKALWSREEKRVISSFIRLGECGHRGKPPTYASIASISRKLGVRIVGEHPREDIRWHAPENASAFLDAAKKAGFCLMTGRFRGKPGEGV